ncbi:Sec-independent protein translocase protein TatB [Pasteurella atlantica]|uniref:Sec-independent protein translocase protein TatB n=1 Tax=Pasteurella atlantica TaxID=2827233 RepID=A0AAW8CQF7_9PAST|nr:Sec-independent protein translocase subunit TatB [Pasteurella atlantica]MDP8038869.1 Sec-independent protein translocase protein TatB [Pasteurella atlantica]MDP8041022.1 Sec-independent protein translocase protein TatB [Pasteurella atlantica]MDP8043158.1 Sec-independent protein translocase protein TatB [Pasteurella atlantica]MDP8045244.1 Sec-independent protein translocase protein TatB [Pasteurella atlantica]
MFDIGFSELLLIFIIGLVVLGPQRLPLAIKTVMGWVGAIKNLANNVRDELSEELRLQELQESIKKAEKMNLQSLSPELSETISDLKRSAKELEESIKKDIPQRDENTPYEDELAELAEDDEDIEEIYEDNYPQEKKEMRGKENVS